MWRKEASATRPAPLALLVLLASAGMCAAPPSRRVVHRVLPCGQFSVEATSVVALPGDHVADDVLSQSVRLTNLSTRRTVAIGAPQHLSPDSNIGGRPALDMPAYDMACFRLRTGKDFVTLRYTCTNPDATTCPPAMDCAMRTVSAAFLALLASTEVGAAAVPHRIIHRVLPCGSFQVEASTDVARPGQFPTQDILSQSIRLTNLLTHRTVTIGVTQHMSRDSNIGERPAIDMPVSNMACIRLRTGEDFVMLYSVCINPDATTCPPAMDWRPEDGTPGRSHEETWTYDANGRAVPETDAHDRAGDEYRRLRALGLFPRSMPQGTDLLW